jgi:hypothetical protein
MIVFTATVLIFTFFYIRDDIVSRFLITADINLSFIVICKIPCNFWTACFWSDGS